jgi:hypothetical protein
LALRGKKRIRCRGDNVAFDPHSEAVIPKALLVERQHRSGSEPLESVSEHGEAI